MRGPIENIKCVVYSSRTTCVRSITSTLIDSEVWNAVMICIYEPTPFSLYFINFGRRDVMFNLSICSYEDRRLQT